MDDNNNIKLSRPVPPFLRYCSVIIPTAFDDSLSYYEALCALYKWLQTNVIDTINHNANVTNDFINKEKELEELFEQLKEYVDTYFENLDVQEEINNKLDEMAEDGELADIISQYLNSTAVFGYNTVADMKLAENLINGSYAKTLGYYIKNDGGGASYYITNDALLDPNDKDIILLDSGLKAVLTVDNNLVSVKQFGAYGDDEHDDTTYIQRAIDYSFDKGINTVYLPSATYKTLNPIYLLEGMKLQGENSNKTIIHKVGNGTGDKEGLQKDAIIILADSTYGNGSTLSYDKRRYETIEGVKLIGNIDQYVADKADSAFQYAIWCIGYAPYLTIRDINITKVDSGIYAVGSYISSITNIKQLTAHYDAIRLNNESQGTIVANVNTLGTHRYGIYLAGATYGSVQATLVEWLHGGTAYRFSNWHGDLQGSGFELGDGPNTGFSFIDSEVRITGGYFFTGTPDGSTDNKMISVSGSSVTIANSSIGTYNQSGTYNGKFATIYNGSITIENNNKYFCTFSEDCDGTGNAFITMNGKTYDVLRDIVFQQSSDKNFADKFDYIDTAINPTKKHIRNDIYFGNITNPMSDPVNGGSSYGPAYNKGDIGFFKNILPTGKAGWICNRDNHSDLQKSAGTISAINGNVLTMTDAKTEDYDKTGIRFYINASIKGVTSNATAKVSSVSGNDITLTGVSGTFVTGEKIQLTATNFWTDADYLYIPIICSGVSSLRPTKNLIVGQSFYDRTLNKPIWYKGNNVWIDATGATV